MSTLRSFTVAGLRGVRGARTLTVRDRGLLLGGDNGTGKSSLIQGLSLALTGKLGTAPGVELPGELVHHQREDAAAKRVVVELSPRGRIELSGDGAPVCDAEGQAFRDACVGAAPFLRRDELLRVVTQEDVSRLRYFEGFMDVGAVDGLESALHEQVRLRKAAVESAERELRAELDRWSGVLNVRVASTKDLHALVVGRAKEAGLEVAASASWAEVCGAIRGAMQRSTIPAAQRGRLDAMFERAEGLVPPDHPKTALGPLRKAESGVADADVLELLREALEVVKAPGRGDACPVCEQAIAKRALTKRLKERIAAMDELAASRDAAEELAESWTEFFEELEELERFVATQEGRDPAHPRRASEEERPEGRELLEQLAANERLSVECQRRVQGVRSQLAAARKALPTEAQASKLFAIQQALRNATDLAQLAKAEAALAEQRRVFERFKVVERCIADARKTEVQRILGEVEALVRRYYRRIHPNDANDEPTGAPRIVVQRHGKGAARLRGEFDGKEIQDVRHVYSDGHQDTVGLAFFLALRRSRADREGARDPKLMVLDDIVGSIDAGHFDRFLEVLRDEFRDHQIVMASHNALLIQQARAALPGVATETLASWTLETGPELEAPLSCQSGPRSGVGES